MQDLINFFEIQTDKKIKILKYKNQDLKNNQNLVTFDHKTYIIEIDDKLSFNNVKGYYYIIYQQNLEFKNLRKILHNLYEDVNIFEYNNYLILNSNNSLDINLSTPQIIESETYTTTYVAYLGKINDIHTFNFRLSILDELLSSLKTETNLNKFITLHDLSVYKAIELIGKEKSFIDLIDFPKIKNMDENLLHTGISFIENDLNISKTSSHLFLHRNTLIYRLDKIKEILELDLKNFKHSFIFYLSIKSYFASKL